MAQYVCNECGYGSASWYGKCPSCGNWNTFVKFQESKKRGKSSELSKPAEFTPLSSLGSLSKSRIATDVHEFDRVVGGGFISGEVVLLSGEPGVGKSTLLLKALSKLRTMYISGEESGQQIKQRAERINIHFKNFLFSNEICIESVLAGLNEKNDSYDVIVFDSIQTLYSEEVESPVGSVAQIKEVTSRIADYIKSNHKVAIIIGHVTKGGDIAGPKTLEHIVDCVLYLEGERFSSFRVLRAQKNRFGSVDEVGIFEMVENDLKEMGTPTALLNQQALSVPGRSIAGLIEGSRILFYEIQSLVVPTAFPIPRRVVTGIDFNRLQLLLAVMKKYLKISLDTNDVYVNVVGGVSAKSPAADLAIVASIVSSIKNRALPEKTAYIGEIGLLGEVRSMQGEEKLIKTEKRFGMKKIYSSKDIRNISNISLLFN